MVMSLSSTGCRIENLRIVPGILGCGGQDFHVNSEVCHYKLCFYRGELISCCLDLLGPGTLGSLVLFFPVPPAHTNVTDARALPSSVLLIPLAGSKTGRGIVFHTGNCQLSPPSSLIAFVLRCSTHKVIFWPSQNLLNQHSIEPVNYMLPLSIPSWCCTAHKF
jgi:hypothetical protein